ncbi:MAG: hypothetical protein KIT15_11915 [Xanthobacteraceae bacterium]|nr:hypothetical protein [Xanthobacteraceae bacterium]MBX3549158.1 hypothetical protein [Xanthobacteraceae bacterium]MCW5675274.1 hypothetical protein [Xanthobacteraceae bacterium]
MQIRLAALALLLLYSSPALADACKDKFIAVLTNYANTRATVSQNTQQMKGAALNKSEFLWAAPGHYLHKATDPKGPWYLTYDGAMYQSDDEGKNWKKIRTFDKTQQQAGADDNVKKQAASARNAQCGEDTLNGIKHETVEAETDLPNQKVRVHTKYWVNRADKNFVTRAETRMTGDGYEIFTTQLSKPEPSLKLPKP